MRLPAVLVLIVLPLLPLVLGFRLGLGLGHDEAIILQLLDLVLPEVTHLLLGVRAVAFLLLPLGNCFLLSILGLILPLLPRLFSLTTLVASSVLSVIPVIPVIPVSIVALLVFLGLLSGLLLSLDWLGGLSEWSGDCFNSNHGGLLAFLYHWCLCLEGFGLWDCHHNGCNHWGRLGLRHNGCGSLNGEWFRLGLYLFRLFFKDITDNLLLIADNRCNLAVSVFLHVGRERLLQLAVVGEVFE
jgi:hypothetical protein